MNQVMESQNEAVMIPVTFKIDPDDKDRFVQLCKEKGGSMSEGLRRLIKEELSRDVSTIEDMQGQIKELRARLQVLEQREVIDLG